jgi:hypothetical protein
MRRLTRVLDDSTPDVNHASGVQSPIRVLLPPETSTFVAKVQVPAKASVDESLQAAKGLARIGMAEVIHQSPHRLIHLLNKLCGRDRRPPLGEVFNPSSNVALRGLAGKDVDAPLAAFGGTSLHELEPDTSLLLIGLLTPVPPGDFASSPEVTRCSSVPCRPQSPWYGG